MAVYHGLASKHPLVPKLAREMRSDAKRRNSAGGGVGGGDDRRIPGFDGRRSSGGMGGRRASDVSRESVGKIRHSSKVRGREVCHSTLYRRLDIDLLLGKA